MSEETEELDPTPEAQKAVTRSPELKWKSRRKLRNSPIKETEKLIKEVDHTRCGPASAVVSVEKHISWISEVHCE